ncbi:cytochrome c [Allorhizobium sp. BGMRC 0089]|uniref:c-type cytochrome n=1 Tax=Allorhizobium sonneratiae TaxID=2934936 RepID=UPI002033FF2E|nr:cytochrome c [Allorhizobium sonneratiae]MCM2292807.1 cytochrome c [Allorhizobium sonneratiae]
MKRPILTGVCAIVGLCALGGAGTIGFIYSGLFDYRATSPHYPIVTWALHQTYQSSMESRTKDIAIPDNLETAERVSTGAGLYQQHCAICHGAPGMALDPIGKGIYPDAPNLLKATRKNHPNQVYYVAKYGIKMTGMPAFGKSFSDDTLWSIAAFLHKDKGISAADYATLVKDAQNNMPAPASPSQ